MKDKFKTIIIILVIIFLSLYAWNLFLYNKYGGIGRYQVHPITQGSIIDTKTGHIFMPAHPPQALSEAENWYYIDPIRLEDEGYYGRLAKEAKVAFQAGFTQKEIEGYFRELESYRTGREKRKRPKTGLTREEMKSIMTESKKTKPEK